MPDAGASRKRQIQVALRPFGGIAAPGAAQRRILHAAALFCGLSCKVGAWLRSNRRAAAWSAEDSTPRYLPKRGALSNRKCAIRIRSRVLLDSLTPAPCHVAANAGFRAACKRIWTARNMGFCNFFPLFHHAAGLAATNRNRNAHLVSLYYGQRSACLAIDPATFISIGVFMMCLTSSGVGIGRFTRSIRRELKRGEAGTGSWALATT
jgi:hypothetical protein